MSLKKRFENPKVNKNPSNYCLADRRTIVFSFKQFSDSKIFGLKRLEKSDSNTMNVIKFFLKQLQKLSNTTWENLTATGNKNGGTEFFPLSNSMFTEKFQREMQNSGVSLDETIYIVRFQGTSNRLFFRRGSKCNRVAHILGIEFELDDAYAHGN